MAYSGQTTHYGLPKYVSTDKPSWLDTNDAFDTIDAAIYAAATAVDPSTITTMQNDITALQSGKQDVLTFDSAPLSGSINPVTSGGVYTAVNNVSIALGVTDLKVSTLEGEMGNTDISAIGDGTVTGAISSLAGSVGGSVEVTTSGSETHRSALDRLFALIDLAKITNKTTLQFITPSGDTFTSQISTKTSSLLVFAGNIGESNGISVDVRIIQSSNSTYSRTKAITGGTTYTDNSTGTTTDGTIYRINY